MLYDDIMCCQANALICFLKVRDKHHIIVSPVPDTTSKEGKLKLLKERIRYLAEKHNMVSAITLVYLMFLIIL